MRHSLKSIGSGRSALVKSKCIRTRKFSSTYDRALILIDVIFDIKDWSEGPNPERALDTIGLISTIIRGTINIHSIVLEGENKTVPPLHHDEEHSASDNHAGPREQHKQWEWLFKYVSDQTSSMHHLPRRRLNVYDGLLMTGRI